MNSIAVRNIDRADRAAVAELARFGVARTTTPARFEATEGIADLVGELVSDERVASACAERRAMLDPEATLRAVCASLERLGGRCG